MPRPMAPGARERAPLVVCSSCMRMPSHVRQPVSIARPLGPCLLALLLLPCASHPEVGGSSLSSADGHGPVGATSDTNAQGTAAVKAKASNRNFDFSCAEYERMRDSGRPYSGDPRKNKLLPLPRPTYTEFVNRAQKARMLDRLDFLYCPADAPRPPHVDPAVYEIVVWCGVSFRRFTRLWTPERSHFFPQSFQRRALAVLCCAHRLRTEGMDDTGATVARSPRPCATLASLPHELLLDLIAMSAQKHEAAREEYDDLDTVCSGARHLFLPAPGSSGLRDSLFDAVFGL